MPKGYQHLTYDKRCQISALLKRGIAQSQIAIDLEINQSTISREIRRNKGKCGYRHKQAHTKAVSRRMQVNKKRAKFTVDLKMYVIQMLCERQWSPEQISGRMKLLGYKSVSHEVIYQYIWKDKKNGGTLYKHLRRNGKKYNKRAGKTAGRGLIPNRVGIENRPKIVDTKERVGDFEGDTIVGSHHRGAIVSLVDRKTKFTRLKLIPHRTANLTKDAIVSLLSPIKSHVQTITTDNGKEFSEHEKIAQMLDACVYFANPYHSWERGLNENTNGLVRQYFSKKSDFSKISSVDVKNVEFLLNSRPRKTLNFKTPFEVFFQATGRFLHYALQG